MGSDARPRGKVDVLVGIDGSAAATAALLRVAEEVTAAGRMGRMTVVQALPPAASLEEISAANCNLALAAAEVSRIGVDATAAVVRGEPADALRRYARAHRFDLIAVGTRGAGATSARVGTTARHLVRSGGPGSATVVLIDAEPATPAQPTALVYGRKP